MFLTKCHNVVRASQYITHFLRFLLKYLIAMFYEKLFIHCLNSTYEEKVLTGI